MKSSQLKSSNIYFMNRRSLLLSILISLATVKCDTKSSSLPTSDLACPIESPLFLAVGGMHSCISDGTDVCCWGSNSFGQIGIGTTSASERYPKKVQGLNDTVTKLTAGEHHTCVLTNTGVKCWGYNGGGQLGIPISTTFATTPQEVRNTSSTAILLASGANHNCIVLDGGLASCWGYNYSKQLGSTTTELCGSLLCSTTPAPVTSLSGVTYIAAGESNSCVITTGGSAKCWGANFQGQLGNNSNVDSTVPVQVLGLTSGVTSMSLGYFYTCAVKDGALWCWGINHDRQLGSSSFSNSSSNVPVATDLITNVQAVAAGYNSTCAIQNGGVKCWGSNDVGHLGINSTTNTATPSQVVGITIGAASIGTSIDGLFGQNTNYTKRARHTCAIVGTRPYCWGDNSYGQLGSGDTASRTVPTLVKIK